MNKEEFTKDLENWSREEIINRAYEICLENNKLRGRNILKSILFVAYIIMLGVISGVIILGKI